MLLADTAGGNDATNATTTNNKRNAKEKDDELTQPVAMLAPTSYWLQNHKRRSKAQKKIWRSFRQPGVGPGSNSPSPNFLQLQQSRQQEQPKASPFSSYTPVKDLIYHSEKKKGATGNWSSSSYMDVNAATFLFASQMKLTLNG
jgi:hypothetical protein